MEMTGLDAFVIFMMLCVVFAEEPQIELKTYIPPVGYVAIALALLIGLGIIAALVIVLLKGRQAEVIDEDRDLQSTSGPKPSVLDINNVLPTGHYIKEAKKSAQKNKKIYPGQKTITSEEKKLFTIFGSLPANSTNACSPLSKYVLDRQTTETTNNNRDFLKNVLAKNNALSKLSDIHNPLKTDSIKNKQAQSRTRDIIDKTSICEQSRKISSLIKNSKILSGRILQSENKALSNINPKHCICPTVIAPKSTILRNQTSGLDVASKLHSQYRSKRIVGALSEVVNDKIIHEATTKNQGNKTKFLKSFQRNFELSTIRDRNVWTRNHLSQEVYLENNSI